MITVACVWVEANVPFGLEYVDKLRSMVRRRIPYSHRFVCLTDRPRHCESVGVEPIRIERPVARPGWWSKIELFNPAHGLAGECLYLDLDVLLVADITPILLFNHWGLALIPHAGSFEGRQGLKVVKRYNSSVMRFTPSAELARLWAGWTPGVARRLWGDQDWIGEQMPAQPTMPLEWFPRISEIKRPARDAKVVLMKRPKNHIAAEQWPWVREIWR
jgi:hypothetical protein